MLLACGGPLLACGGDRSNGIAGAEGPGSIDAGGTNPEPEDATISTSDGQVFTSDPGSPTPSSFKCQPGTYRGCFDTKVAGIATWSGALSITLVASDAGTSHCTGEGLDCQTSLTIAPGAQLSGKDQMGGAFALNLSGSLDCTPDSGPPMLSGTLNGGYCFFSAGCAPDAGLNITGGISAVYMNMPPVLSGLNSVVDGGLSVCTNSGDGGCVFAGAMGGQRLGGLARRGRPGLRWLLTTANRPFALAALLSVLSGCSTTLNLGSNDAGILYDADCKPGTYTGTYSCTTSAGSPIQLAGSGPIAITLVPSGAGTLSLTPDASLASTSAGTVSDSVLSGVLDCATGQLTGVVSDVTFSSPTFKGMISGIGTLTAVYEDDGGLPSLLQGILDPPPTLTTMCTWTATLE